MRQLFTVATVCGLALSLTACAGSEGPESTTTLNAPSEPPRTESPSESQPPAVNLKLGEEAASSSTAPTEPRPMEDCVVVAAGVSSVLLAPLSFMGDEDRETMDKLEDQLRDLEVKVPTDLKPYFVRVADAAESGAPGSGHFDEAAFRTALEPIQQWLQKHCNEPAG